MNAADLAPDAFVFFGPNRDELWTIDLTGVPGLRGHRSRHGRRVMQFPPPHNFRITEFEQLSAERMQKIRTAAEVLRAGARD